jgi:hypothetical protein
MLLELAAQYCLEKEGRDQEKNTQITFHFTDRWGNVGLPFLQLYLWF